MKPSEYCTDNITGNFLEIFLVGILAVCYRITWASEKVYDSHIAYKHNDGVMSGKQLCGPVVHAMLHLQTVYSIIYTVYMLYIYIYILCSFQYYCTNSTTTANGPQRTRLPIPPTATLPSLQGTPKTILIFLLYLFSSRLRF